MVKDFLELNNRWSKTYFLPTPSPPGLKTLSKFPPLRNIKDNLSVYLFLDSEPRLGKSKEFNNQRVKVNKAFKSYSIFFARKTIKNRQSLHIF